jgi:hypothetical protein
MTMEMNGRPTTSGTPYRSRLLGALLAISLSMLFAQSLPASPGPTSTAQRLLQTHLLVTWYGNPRSCQMGVLGEFTGQARADGLRRQAAAYEGLTTRRVVPAYHLVAVVAQPSGDKCRRRETPDLIQSLLVEARENGFKLVLDIQPGHSAITVELEHLRPFLAEPDVYLAIDPEFAMEAGQVPGRQRGAMRAADVNAAVAFLDQIITDNQLPPKVLIVHQFTLDMLPDKHNIRGTPRVDVVLDMDGFGSQPLKLASYRAVMRQGELDFAGIKLFYKLDKQLFSPEQIMALRPMPSVVIYQ